MSTVTEGDSDSDGDWIAPKDLLPGGKGGSFGDFGQFEAPDETGVSVGCVTQDYSMQNVLLQIGLTLMSLQGMVVHSVKQWVLKCDSCMHMTTEMDRMFCPECGNPSLARLGVTLQQDGTPRFHYRRNRVCVPAFDVVIAVDASLLDRVFVCGCSGVPA